MISISNTPILNREFKHPADGWYHIEPRGEHPNTSAGVVQVIDDEACQTIVNRFNADADAGNLSHGNEMLIDHEHFSHDDDKETRAFGWLTRLENRTSGIYGQIRWTTTGKVAVDGGDYRFFSTEYNPEDLQPVRNQEKVKSGKMPDLRLMRPLALAGLTLTNRPNNRGGRPITNSKKDLPDKPANSPAGVQADIQNKRKTTMKLIAQRLGLSADASEEAILGELTKLENRANTTVLTQERDTLRNRVTELEGENGTLLDEQIDTDLASHKITEEKVLNRLKPVLKTMKNRADRVAFITDCVGKPSEAASAQKKLFNRSGNAPGVEKTGEVDEKAIAQRISNRASELKGAAPSRDFGSCWQQAQQEILAPETK